MFPFAQAPSLGFLINDVNRLLRQRFDTEASSLGMTLPACRVLTNIHRRPGQRPADLAVTLEMSAVVVARLIERMERQGLVAREPDPRDRRAKLVHVLPAAQPILDALYAAGQRTWDYAMAALTDEQIVQLEGLLEIVREVLTIPPPLAVKD